MGTIAQRRPRRWARALLIVALCLITIAVAAWALSSMQPAWYAPRQEQLLADETLARSMEDQFHALGSWAELSYVQEKARLRGRRLEVPPPPETFELEFSAEQINAFAGKWVPIAAHHEGGALVRDVFVHLLDGEARLGAQLPRWSGQRIVSVMLRESPGGLVASSPRIGRLPVPVSLLPVTVPRDSAPGRGAQIDEGGKGNNRCLEAAWARLGRQLLDGRLRDDRCLLPGPMPLAVRIERRLEPGKLRLVIRPLSKAEREQYLLELQSD